MTKLVFHVTALWDDESQVFYSESNITGLHIEADTIEEFEAIMSEVAPQLVMANHLTKNDFTQRTFADMIPSIFFKEEPTNQLHA